MVFCRHIYLCAHAYIYCYLGLNIKISIPAKPHEKAVHLHALETLNVVIGVMAPQNGRPNSQPPNRQRNGSINANVDHENNTLAPPPTNGHIPNGGVNNSSACTLTDVNSEVASIPVPSADGAESEEKPVVSRMMDDKIPRPQVNYTDMMHRKSVIVLNAY